LNAQQGVDLSHRPTDMSAMLIRTGVEVHAFRLHCGYFAREGARRW
jgi:hypothetical protein